MAFSTRLRRGLAWSLLSGGAAFLAVEAFVRFRVEPVVYINRNLVEHPRWGWITRPGLSLRAWDERGRYPFVMNADGFRSPELPAEGEPAPAGTKRVLFVGDSFLQAWKVREEERIPEVMGAHLAEAGVPNEVYTLACDGYGTMQQLLLLRELGERIDPDVVVLSFFTGNDFADNGLELAPLCRGSGLSYLRPYPEWSGPESRARATYANPFRSFLRHRSRMFRVLEKQMFLARSMDSGGRFHPWPVERLAVAERVQRGLLPHEHLGYLAPADPGTPWAAAKATTQRLLVDFAAEVEALGARFLVLVIPSYIQVFYGPFGRQRDLTSVREGGPPLDELVDWNLPERDLAELFEREEIDARFLLPALRSAVSTDAEHPVHVYDRHLGHRGHALAGRIAARWYLGEDPEWDADPSRFGEPVDLLDALGPAAGWQDFREGPSYVYAGTGWKTWKGAWGEFPGGWTVGQRATAILPVRSGSVVLRGYLPEGSSLPATVSLTIWAARKSITEVLESPGGFELVLDPGEVSLEELNDLEGSMAIIIASDASLPSDFGSGAGLVVQELGFRSP